MKILMKLKERWLRDKRFRRRILTVVSAVALYAFAISAIFAYFSSSDLATNRFSGKSIGLELYEPGWDAAGEKMASAAEPGMLVPKDPYVKNTGEMDVVARLKLSITLDTSNEPTLPQGNNDDLLTVRTDSERIIAILRALTDENNESVFTVEPLTNQPLEGNADSVRFGGSDYYVMYNKTDVLANGNQKAYFLVEAASASSGADLYFYYIGGNYIGGVGEYAQDTNGDPFTQQQTVLGVLGANESTPALFNKVAYPIYKTDFLTIFDRGFTIDVTAEGILTKDFDERGLPYTVENFKRIQTTTSVRNF